MRLKNINIKECVNSSLNKHTNINKNILQVSENGISKYDTVDLGRIKLN